MTGSRRGGNRARLDFCFSDQDPGTRGGRAMDWKVAAWTFGIVFLAELGDKTQLATLALAGRTGRPGAVFLGASAALVAVTLLGVAAGAALKKFLPGRALGIAS